MLNGILSDNTNGQQTQILCGKCRRAERAMRGPLDCNRQSERQAALERCPPQCANALPWGFQQEEQEAVLGHCSSAVENVALLP